MALREGINTEFKESYVPDVKKTIIAFANTKGGTIYLGVDDGGNVIGIENPDAVIQQVSNAVRDSSSRRLCPSRQFFRPRVAGGHPSDDQDHGR